MTAKVRVHEGRSQGGIRGRLAVKKSRKSEWGGEYLRAQVGGGLKKIRLLPPFWLGEGEKRLQGGSDSKKRNFNDNLTS